jgi:hypothetical protein
MSNDNIKSTLRPNACTRNIFSSQIQYITWPPALEICHLFLVLTPSRIPVKCNGSSSAPYKLFLFVLLSGSGPPFAARMYTGLPEVALEVASLYTQDQVVRDG